MGAIKTFSRYWETLRWLKLVQLYGRLWFRLTRPRVDERQSPAPRTHSGPWIIPARRRASLLGPGEFLFLTEPGSLGELGWDSPDRTKLWRYNQHYFDDLNAAGAPSRREWHEDLLAEWLSNNPPGEGTSWEPYPTSIRIVNWIKWSLAGNDLGEAGRHSLAVQVRWLMQRLEWHLLGNHLLANAKALVFAGLWFSGDEALTWLNTGLRIIKSQLPEQVLPDGGQFELSPMYHALALEDVLDLVNITRRYSAALSVDQQELSAAWTVRACLMRRWLAALSHPDGDIAFFNDAAFGIAPANTELEAYAVGLGVPEPEPLGQLTWLADSGYARLAQPAAVVIADLARVGPDYLPGHAHADTLSFETSVFGHRLFVNSGTSVYGTGAERLRQRGTAAHTTVAVSGYDSSDVWSGFRVGRRARPLDRHISRTGDVLFASASHDGYRRLPGRPLHMRSWRLGPDSLEVEDRLACTTRQAEARFHLHPDIRATIDAPGTGTFLLPGDRPLRWTTVGGRALLQPTTWHPEFGRSQPTLCLIVPLLDGGSLLNVAWD